MLSAFLRNGQLDALQIVLILVSYAALIFVTLPVHELAHAWAATKLGDDTPRWNGRLRFSPLAHLDLMGTLMLVLFGFGYAKPVPVNPRNFRNPKRDMALTALAGPLSNILMAAAALLIFRILLFFDLSPLVLMIAQTVLVYVFASVNLGLAVFNLLPIPPLDGSRIFAFVLPDRWVYAMERYSRYISLLLMLLIFMGKLSVPLNFLSDLIGNGLCALMGLPALF